MKRLIKIRKVNLATLLTLLVAASVILTLIILTYSSYHSNEESLTDTYLALNYSKAEKMSDSVNSVFGSMRTNLESMKKFLEGHEEMTDGEISEQLDLLRTSSGYFNSLIWVDETALVRTVSPASVGLAGKKLTSEVTRQVLDQKEPGLTTPYMSSTGRLLILMSQPIYYEDGRYRGIIGGSIYLQEQNVLNQILGNDAVEKNGSYYFVVGPKGTLLFHPDRKQIGENVRTNSIIPKVMEGKSGMELVTNTKGVPMLAAYSHVKGPGWGIVQQTPYVHIQDSLVAQLRQLLLDMTLPFLLLLLISVFIARKLAAPFIRLGNLVDLTAEGKDVSESLKENLMKPHWNREADLLSRSVGQAIGVLEKNNQQLTTNAFTDALTGLPNRRKMDEVLAIWSSEGRLFSMLVLDIDHFKLVNDTYGHQRGDEVLKKLADTLLTVIRENDYCFRYGGEEFVLLLDDTNASKAYAMAEKIRRTIEKTELISEKTITVSLGVSEFPAHSNSIQALFELADRALYQSKSGGRNRVTVSS